MTAEGHLICALASTIIAQKVAIVPGDWWHVIGGSVLTCLLPDLDHPRSVLGQRLTWLSVPIAKVFGHRGFTHSLLAMAALILLFHLCHHHTQEIMPMDAGHGMIIGYLSHIIADMLTPAGVPLLWPCRWRFRLPIKNKSVPLERIVGVVLLAIVILVWWPWMRCSLLQVLFVR